VAVILNRFATDFFVFIGFGRRISSFLSILKESKIYIQLIKYASVIFI